jgi:hypothetical protein
MEGVIRVGRYRSFGRRGVENREWLWILFAFIAHDLLILSATFWPVLFHHPAYQRRPGYLWFQWDSLYYVIVGDLGYTHLPGIAKYKNTAFFPFVPMLVRMFGAWGAVVIEQLTMALTLALMYWYGKRMGLSQAASIRSVWLFALCPAAIFYSTIYAEPWTVFGTLASLFLAVNQRWIFAALSAAVTSLTQGTGVLVGMFPLVLFIRSLYQKNYRLLFGSVVWGLGAAFGLGLYMAYLGSAYHDPLLFSKVQPQMWHSYWRWPWLQFIQGLEPKKFTSTAVLHLVYEFIAITYVVGACFLLTRSIHPTKHWEITASRLYTLMGLLVSFSFYPGHTPFYSAIRIASVYFPMYTGLGVGVKKTWFTVILVVFIVVAYLGTSRFTHGYFFQ